MQTKLNLMKLKSALGTFYAIEASKPIGPTLHVPEHTHGNAEMYHNLLARVTWLVVTEVWSESFGLLTECRHDIHVLCDISHICAYWTSFTVMHVIFFIVKCGIMHFLCAMHVFDVWASSSSPRLPLCQILFLSWPPLLSWPVEKIAYSINQSINQSTNQSTNQSLTYSVTHPSYLMRREPKLSLWKSENEISNWNVRAASGTCNAQIFIQPLQQPDTNSSALGLNASDVTVVTWPFNVRTSSASLDTDSLTAGDT